MGHRREASVNLPFGVTGLLLNADSLPGDGYYPERPAVPGLQLNP
jgi:hypothetical protein